MQPDNMVGQTLGHYSILRLLGYGGTAMVFLARDNNLQREVALKVFQPRQIEMQEIEDFLRRFAREARILAQLDHPNILPVYDYGEQDSRAYLVMPHMVGGSLRDRLRKSGALSASEAIPLINQVLDALQYAHDRGLIHRDVKPGNMLFKANGSVFLADFGLVKILPTAEGVALENTANTTKHAINGTPDYMAPEQITGDAVPASDIYSVGVVFYEMLSGQRPFRADTYMGVLMKQLHEPPRPLREIAPQVSPMLEAAVMRALEKDPTKRYLHAADFRQALVQAMTEQQGSTLIKDVPLPNTALPNMEQPAASPPARLVKPTPKRRRTPLFVALIVLLVLLVGAGGILYASRLFAQPQPGKVVAKKGNGAPTAVATASPAPSTTACPSPNTARIAVMTPVNLGTTPNVVYIANEGTFDNPIGKIKRYDPAADKFVDIKDMSHTHINDAQVSQDEQWVFFNAKVNGQNELGLVRIDGKQLQTLYCAPTGKDIFSPQWSFGGQWIIFDVDAGNPVTYLLDMRSGNLQQELIPQGNQRYEPRFWFSTTGVYLTAITPQSHASASQQNIYILDTQKGSKQHDNDLQIIFTGALSCIDFDAGNIPPTAPKQLFMSTCVNNEDTTRAGPSSITLQPNTGGPSKTIYKNSIRAVTAVRSVTNTTLLFMIENTDGHTDENGLWRIETDGTHLQQLAQDTNNSLSLCPFSQYNWSDISPDNKMYALQGYDQNTHTSSLYIGSLDGSAVHRFLNNSDGPQFSLVGWANM